MDKKEFHAIFQLSKTDIFEVRYYRLERNVTQHFATAGASFIRSKRDYWRCGQCQVDLLENYPAAQKFYQKWDKWHLMEMDTDTYREMRDELKDLSAWYNYIVSETEPSFDEIKELSKQKLKRFVKL